MNNQYEYTIRDLSLEWAHDQIKKIDKFYSTKIPDENLRFLFIRALSNSFIQQDPILQNELDRCGFDWIHYYFMEDDFEEIEKSYREYIQDQKEYYFN